MAGTSGVADELAGVAGVNSIPPRGGSTLLYCVVIVALVAGGDASKSIVTAPAALALAAPMSSVTANTPSAPVTVRSNDLAIPDSPD